MKATLVRHTFDAEWTLGSLYIDGLFECFMLEDPDRMALGFEKVPGETAIPSGQYEVAWTWSPKFARMLPLLLDVEGYTGVRVHPGNWARETEGCLLPGLGLAKGRTVSSVKAFTPLASKIRAAQTRGGFQLDIHRATGFMSEEQTRILKAAWAVVA